jgi:chorismate-pyruvate lyase
MEQNIFDAIKKIEKDLGNLSSAQKILLTTDGSVTTILDVLKGYAEIETLIQEFILADKDMADDLGISPDEDVNYRVVIIKTSEPLIHATSFIPIKRLDKEFKEDLIQADIPIGRILKKHKIESRREIKSVEVNKASPELVNIFHTDSPMLTRTYNIIHKGEVLIRIKETFPYSLFRE